MYVSLPCLQFSSREREIIKEVNPCILTFPEFHDNYFVRYKRFGDRNWIKLFLNSIEKYRDFLVFVIYPDGQFNYTWLLDEYNVNWVYPLHYKRETDFILKYGFEWIGIPHRSKWRDYDMEWYFDFTKQYGLKRWYLGWWLEREPELLREFDGFDTTLPEFYAYKCGKIWYSPYNWERVGPTREYKAIDLFRLNVENFNKWIQDYLGNITCVKESPHCFGKEKCSSQ